MFGQGMMMDPRYPYQRPYMTDAPGGSGAQHMPHYNMLVNYLQNLQHVFTEVPMGSSVVLLPSLSELFLIFMYILQTGPCFPFSLI